MIYNYKDYRIYLVSRLGQRGTRTGLRKRLAEHLGVHTTLVSQVLLGKAEFSLEQAEGCNIFFEHDENESEYFLLLVIKDRAGTVQLKNRFKKKIELLRADQLNISKRISDSIEVTPLDQSKFYSSYLCSAIHVLVSIPEFQNFSSLAKKLNMEKQELREIVFFLEKIGAVVKNGDQLNYGPQHINLDKNSHLIQQHHTNWRIQAISSLAKSKKEDLHYSSILSLSKKDAYRIKDSILMNFEENVKIITSSKEEVAFVYNFDFYEF